MTNFQNILDGVSERKYFLHITDKSSVRAWIALRNVMGVVPQAVWN